MKSVRPRPIVTQIKCSVCDLPWEQHKGHEDDTVKMSECVRLLKLELAQRPRPYISYPWTYTYAGSGSWGTPLKGAQWAIPTNTITVTTKTPIDAGEA